MQFICKFKYLIAVQFISNNFILGTLLQTHVPTIPSC